MELIAFSGSHSVNTYGTSVLSCCQGRPADEIQAVPPLRVFRPGRDQTDTGGSYAGEAQDVRQLYDVPAGPVKHSGSRVPQIVRKRLRRDDNSKSFSTGKFVPENHPKADPDCVPDVPSASSRHNEQRYEFTGDTKFNRRNIIPRWGLCFRRISVMIPVSK